MPNVYDGINITKKTGNTQTDLNMNFQGFKYPDRVYGHKFNAGYNKDFPKASALHPKGIHKGIRFSNMQSLSYY